MSDKPQQAGIASRVYAVFAKLLIGIFGRPNWDAPSWLKWIGKKLRSLGRWSIAHQGASFAILFALSAATAGGWKFRAWWNARPKPALTNWTVAAPTGLPRFDGMNKIDLEPMSISFSRSAAPIATVDKVITKGIEISPAIAGEWKWAGDRNLVFTPKGDWAIGQKYTVKLSPKDLVATHVLIEKQKEEFETAPFQVYLDEQKYYQDPLDENLKRVLATFRFSHPVDAASFEKLVKLHFVPTTVADEKEQDYKFEVSYEKMLTLAYVKSTSITLPQKNATMHITVDPGTKAKRGSAPFDKKLAGKTNVPGLYNFIGIDTVASYVVDNERMEADVVLRIESNARISAAEIKKNIQVWQLPLYYEEEEKEKKRPHRWNNEEVDTKSLKKNDLVALTQLPERDDPSEGHTFRYRAEAGRYLYIEIAKGTKAFGGYVLAEAHNAVVRVPKAPPRVKLMHQGSLISLSGERKIGAAVRDAPAVRYEVARVLGDQTHHLFTATNGSFADPSFKYPFTEQNFTERFEEVHATKAPAGKNTFDALDLGKYLGGSEGKRGLFVVKVQSWDPDANRSLGEMDQRLMLVTDLGMVVKDAADGTHQVFVQSIHTGDAVAGAKVQVLGKNGAAVVSESTNGQGMATLPSFAGFTDEKTPVVYVASRGKDATYLPIGRSERYVNMSRFNTGGVHQDSNKKGMSAFVFSDRGIYRPGEEMIFGAIVRNDDWSKSLAGLPLLFVLTDARGKTLSKQQLNASPSAFEEYRYKTDETSPTGTYKLELFLADAKGAQSIGSTNVVVREFQPDKLKISVTMNHPQTDGWLKPTDLKARVHLTNLFGTPATDRKVKGALTVSSGMPRFAQFKDYNFFDPLKPRYVSVERYEEQTDDEGNAEFDLDATAFSDATYRLSFVAEGFEKEGGRSVGGEVGAWVSPLEYFLGYRTSADLGYLPKAAEAEVELIAVGPSGKRVAVKDLDVTIYEKKSLSVLAKEPDGTYRYETINREVEVSTKKLSINGDGGTKWKIPTANPGSFVVKFFDKHVAVNSFDYLVAGAALEAKAGGNADLQLNLKSKDVEAGQALSVQIKAPYTGAGLITIERDRVYTHRWFKTTTATSVQTINVPPAMEGDAYVSVIFLRDPSSPEVFLSPLSYGVVPFSISQAKRTAKLTLTSNDKVKPGETVSMKLVSDKPTRAVVFAVDEGILRVARYQTPNPLKFFFQKRALGVQTAQLLDLVLPDFARLLKAYAPGGGDDEDGEGGGGKKALAANLNPFKRKTNKPVAYWSGIVDVGPEGKELSYVVPDYFNGTLRVMAVAAGPDAIGAAERETIVRGDFVLQPTAPLVVAPGDEFEVPLLVANNVAGSGKKPDVEVALEVSKHFEIVGNAKHKVTIGEMKESSVSFKLKATKALGSGTLKFSAKTGDKSGKASIDISVRPSSPYLVTMKGGRLASGEAKVQLDRKMYPEYREQKAGISYLPVGLSHGLTKYLEKFPHACTEQVTSMAVPAIVLGQLPEFGFKPAEVAQSWETYINTLRARQTTTGAFGRWARNPRIDSYASLYATHVMLEAKDRGQKVPDDVLKLSLAYAQTVAADTIETMEDARSRAYAIYVLTRAGKTTTPLSAKLQKQLEVKFKKEWRQDLAAVYLAAALKLGKQDKLGEGLLESIKLNAKIKADYANYYDPLMRDTQVLYLLAKHFPERLAGIPSGDVEAALAPIYNGGFNTFSAAFGVMALEQYGKAAEQLAPDALSIAEQTGDSGVPKALALPKSMMPFVPFEDVATKLVFGNKGQVGAYWLVSEQGFDVTPADKPIVQKLEVSRRMFNAEGKEITEIGIGEEVTMHVLVRSLGGEIPMLALIDLLPGGFEVVINDEAPASDSSDDEQGGDAPPRDRDEGEEGGDGYEGEGGEGSEGDDTGAGDSSGGGPSFSLPFMESGSSFSPEYGDVREDRIVLYGSASSTVQTFIYKAKATTAGTFQVPPVQASSMYDRTALARSAPAKIKVIKK